MTDGPPATIAFLGFGLIGGSIARALGRDPKTGAQVERPRLVAWAPSGTGPAAAVRDDVIDVAASSPDEAIGDADLIVIAAPATDAIAIVRRLGTDLAPALRPGAVVTDVTSTKGAIVAAAAEAGVRFVGGHPMAGRESSGYDASTADLFVDRPWVVVPGDAGRDEDVEAVRWLAVRCGARPMLLSAAAHDAATAAVSHLPLVVAAALVETLHGQGPDPLSVATTLAASGWGSATRLARGDARMGAGIVATNAAAIATQVRAMRDALDAWLAVLEDGQPDPDALEARFEAARSSLTSMDNLAS